MSSSSNEDTMSFESFYIEEEYYEDQSSESSGGDYEFFKEEDEAEFPEEDKVETEVYTDVQVADHGETKANPIEQQLYSGRFMGENPSDSGGNNTLKTGSHSKDAQLEGMVLRGEEAIHKCVCCTIM